jgi:hypothetical protein
MRRPNAALSTLFATLCIAGCAATHVTPVSMTQPGDDHLTCLQLTERIAAKAAISVVPIAGLLAIASVDLSNEEQVRARSIIDRNERLIILAHSKGCSET